MMLLRYPVMFERAEPSNGSLDLYYAHVPALGLTTHGEGVEGARAAVIDRLSLWLAEKQANGESVPPLGECIL
jgi:predicted RNase H-like HicB family nuclease